MPITVGSRLDQLRALRRRLDAEIEHEERALLTGPGGKHKPIRVRVIPASRPRDDDDGSLWGTREKRACLVRMHATTAEVRTWARLEGLTISSRGPLHGTVMRAYEIAHTQPTITVMPTPGGLQAAIIRCRVLHELPENGEPCGTCLSFYGVRA